MTWLGFGSMGRIGRRLLLAGLILLAVAVIGALFDPAQFFFSYLVGWILWFSVALGSLAVLMIYHLAGGMWGYVSRRPLEAATRTLPLVAILILPLLPGMRILYPWAQKGAEVVEVIAHKSAYLNIPFFLARIVFYFVIWIYLAWLFNRESARQDLALDLRTAERMRNWSGPGLIVYAVTVAFAGWDWIMSLQPQWYSTIFSMLMIAGQLLTAIVFAVLVVALLSKKTAIGKLAEPAVFKDLGNLMLMSIMLWGYMAFSQFLIIWTGNLKNEIQYYLPRMKTSWVWLGLALIVLYFALPFFLLLFRWTKKNRQILAGVAALMLIMRLMDLIWTIEPSLHPEHLVIHWMDILIPLGLGGVWCAAFAGQLATRPLLVQHDPRVEPEAHDD